MLFENSNKKNRKRKRRLKGCVKYPQKRNTPGNNAIKLKNIKGGNKS